MGLKRLLLAIVAAVLCAPPGFVLAIEEGPLGATTGDSALPIEGLALSAESRDYVGSVSARVPIEVPPGRNGFAPDLGLVYSFRNAAAVAGPSWDLPLGVIQRSTRLGPPRYQDSDAFVLTLPTGGAVELTPLGGGEYGARLDDMHAKITADPVANTWTVRLPNGRKYVFGTVAGSRVGPDASLFGQTYSWHATQVTDANGNTIDIQYLATSTWFAYPTDISYGGNASGIPHAYRVHLEWTLRDAEGMRMSHAAGFYQVVALKLWKIVLTTGTTPIRTYEVTWSSSVNNRAPQLTSVRQRGSDNALLTIDGGGDATTTFAYASHPAAAGEPTFAAPRGVELGVDRFRDSDDCNNRDFVDMNGDGRPDLVLTGGWNDPSNRKWNVYLNQGPTAAQLFASQPIAWDAPEKCLRRNVPLTFSEAGGGPVGLSFAWSETRVVLSDMNGDGRPDYVDVVKRPSTSIWDVRVHPNTGTGFGAPVIWLTRTAPNPSFGPTNESALKIQINSYRWHGPDGVGGEVQPPSVSEDLLDLDADGKPELVISGPDKTATSWQVHRNGGSGLGPAEAMAGYGTLKRFDDDGNTIGDTFDVNGDGLVDQVVAKGNVGGNWRWDVWLGTGRRFAGIEGSVAPQPPYEWAAPAKALLRRWNSGGRTYDYDLLDINGDRLPDLVDATAQGNPWQVSLNTGLGFAAAIPWAASSPLRKKHPTTNALLVDTFDVTGDGYPDVVALPGGSGTVAQVHVGHPVPYPGDALRSMKNAIGGTTTFRYAVSTAFDTGSVDGAVGDGRPHLPFPTWVLAGLTRDPGNGQPTDDIAYVYDGGYFDTVRREFRGFAIVSTAPSFSLAAGRSSTPGELTLYHQSDALRGRPSVKARFGRAADWSSLVEVTANTWTPTAIGARFVVELTKTVRTDISSTGTDEHWVAGTSRVATTTLAYDACGSTIRKLVEDTSDANARVEETARFDDEPHYTCDAHRRCTGAFCDRPSRTTIVDATSPVVRTLGYDAGGNETTNTRVGSGNPTITRVFDPIGNLTREEDARHTVRTLTYDGARLRVQDDKRTAPDATFLTTTTHWDARWGKPIDVTDVSGAVTSYTYDAFGRLQKVIEPGQTSGQPTRRYEYHLSVGQFRRATFTFEPRRSGDIPTWEFFDGFGRALQTQTLQEVAGNEVTVITKAVRRRAGGLVGWEYPAAATGTGVQDLAAPTAARATEIEYDEFGRPIRRRAPDGTVQTTSYRAARAQRTCDAVHGVDATIGKCTEDEKDANGRLAVRRIFKGAQSTPYATEFRIYDGAGRIKTVTQNGQPSSTVTTTYDALGRKATFVDPDAGTWGYAYDGNDNLVFENDPGGDRHVEMAYDGFNRLLRKAQIEGEDDTDFEGERLAPDTVYTWDSALTFGKGRLANVVDASGSTVFAKYDARGNPLESTKQISFDGASPHFTTVNAYDVIGRLESTTLPHGTATDHLRYEYSAQGMLHAIRSDFGDFVHDVHHDEFGRPLELTHANRIVDRSTYAGPGGNFRLSALVTEPAAGGTRLRDLAYERYDANGNVQLIRDQIHGPRGFNSLALTATYDDLSRLSAVTQCGAGGYQSGFGHDAFGNLTSKENATFAHLSSRHQLTSVTAGGPAVPVTHDGAGNMTGMPGGRVLTWDAEGRLTRVEQSPSTVIADYVYDYSGRRVAAKTAAGTKYFFDGFDVEATRVVRHIRAGKTLIASSPIAGTGAVYASAADLRNAVLLAHGVAWTSTLGLLGVAFFVVPRSRRRRAVTAAIATGALFLGSLSTPTVLAQCDPPDTGAAPPPGTLFYHLDHLGTPQIITGVSGLVVEYVVTRPFGQRAASYDAVGNVVGVSVAAFGFTGYRPDDGSTLLYAGARHYSASLARFVSHDPLRQYFSPYSYLGGNPLNGRDPTGLSSEDMSYNEGCNPEICSMSDGGGGFDFTPTEIGMQSSEFAEPPYSPEGAYSPNPDTSFDFPRLVDYATFAVNFAIWGALGGTLTVSIDRYGHLYGGGGLSLGKASAGASVSLQGGWLWQGSTPTPEQLNGFLTAWAVSGSIGGPRLYNMGVSGTYSPSTDMWSPSAGYFSGTQFGVGGTYSWDVYDTGIGW